MVDLKFIKNHKIVYIMPQRVTSKRIKKKDIYAIFIREYVQRQEPKYDNYDYF